MEKTEKVIISGVTLLTSLLCYGYAKAAERDAAPYVMIGAFLGSLIGETLVEQISSETTYKSITNGSIRNPDI